MRRLLWAVPLLCAACGVLPGRGDGAADDAATEATIDAAYTVQGADGRASARVLTRANACPAIEIDGRAQAMRLRVAAGTVPTRAGGAQADAKPAAFDVTTCEAALPAGVRRASVGGHALAVPAATVNRIVVIGDTGCRLKASEGQFQSCAEGGSWPFADVARSAAAQRPDLVVHVGDYNYRESPCPADAAGCAGSPWGYGSDTWLADLMRPARPLLAAAPWVVVRGNHESCSRAGQGWFRFLDPGPWTEARSCNDPANDADADYSPPYPVALGGGTQLLVFDSSRSGAKAYEANDPAFHRYAAQLRQLDALAGQAPHSFFLSHHPVLGLAPDQEHGAAPSVQGLSSVMRARHPDSLLPPSIELAMHGHEHLFEALSFSSGHAATLVLGNGGSANEGSLPAQLPSARLPFADTRIDDFFTHSGFGYAVLERDGENWNVTGHDQHGVVILRCRLALRGLHCKPVP